MPTQSANLQKPTTLPCLLTCHRSPPSTHTDTGRSPPTAKQPYLILGALHPYRYSHSGAPHPRGQGGDRIRLRTLWECGDDCVSGSGLGSSVIMLFPPLPGRKSPPSNTQPKQNSVPTPPSAAPRSNGICTSPGHWWLVG